MILVAGVVLLTPGFFTDAVGFAFLIPQVRGWVIRTVAARMQQGGSVKREMRVYNGQVTLPVERLKPRFPK